MHVRVHVARRPRTSAPSMALSPGWQKAALLPTLLAWLLIGSATFPFLLPSLCRRMQIQASRVNVPGGGFHYYQLGRKWIEKGALFLSHCNQVAH